MAKTLAHIPSKDCHAIIEQIVSGFDGLRVALHENAETIRFNTDQLQRAAKAHQDDLRMRRELTEAQTNAAIVTEFTARQSRFLAQLSHRIGQKSGVDVSPQDILLGIINGIESSDVCLHHLGTRDDIENFIKIVLNEGARVIRERPDE